MGRRVVREANQALIGQRKEDFGGRSGSRTMGKRTSIEHMGMANQLRVYLEQARILPWMYNRAHGTARPQAQEHLPPRVERTACHPDRARPRRSASNRSAQNAQNASEHMRHPRVRRVGRD
jgi:hypothetical protein